MNMEKTMMKNMTKTMTTVKKTMTIDRSFLFRFSMKYLDDENDADLGKMLDMTNDPGSSSGCTAVVALLRDKELVVANAGDSRCVVCRAGQAIEMSIGSY